MEHPKIYRDKNRNSVLNLTDIKPPKEGFLDKILIKRIAINAVKEL